MNQGRIWCVVHPTVGLPLFLGSVALTSLAVHTAVMTHTNWMGNYWSGSARTKVSEGAALPDAATASKTAAAFSVTVAPATVAGSGAQASFVITVSPTPVVTASADLGVHDPGTLAAAAITPPAAGPN